MAITCQQPIPACTFQLTAARRRLGFQSHRAQASSRISTHSRAKAAGTQGNALGSATTISTHSRAKAAGMVCTWMSILRINFNSQPREGGWRGNRECAACSLISTHSRAKAAGFEKDADGKFKKFQLTAARRRLAATGLNAAEEGWISTHSRAKAAGYAPSYWR